MTEAEKHWRHLVRQKAFVAGHWLEGAHSSRAVSNPATGEVIGTVPMLGAAQVQSAIDAAERALKPWKGMLPRERADVLLRWHNLILDNAACLAELLTIEQGKPLPEAQGEIAYGASFIRWFAEEASRTYGEVIPPHLPARKMLVQKEPLGVVALITPWNFPSAMLTRKAAAALAAGCTTICVPSLETPFSALALAGLAEEAGLPEGIFSVLTGDPATVVEPLCTSAKVRGLSFTGSTQIGRLLMKQCAPTVKRLSLELGGHAPFIVFPDVDPEQAAIACLDAKFQTSGQDCLAANRIFVHKDIQQEFTQAFVRQSKQLVVGDGMVDGCQIGPLINPSAVDKVLTQVNDAVAQGASLMCGGKLHSKGPLFVEPTVLVGINPSMQIFGEETFGPVAGISTFDDEASLIELANASEYGLVAYVFTNDNRRAWRMSDALQYGMVAVNTVQITGAPIPFGGIKQSGLGREGSRHGIDEFLNQKYICMAT